MAENSKKGEHLTRYRFKPGQSGNPGGRPKAKPITELYARILEDPENLAAIKAAVLKTLTRAGSMAMVLMLREMTDRIEGKVTQSIEADVTVTNLAETIAAARKRAGVRGEFLASP
jgi:hypothetical protein